MAMTNEERGFSVTIKASSKELTKKEQLRYRDVSNATKINTLVTGNEPLKIAPTMWVLLHTINEHAKSDQNREYDTLVVVDANGESYYTGSDSFYSSFMEIWDVMYEAGDNGNPAEPFEIAVKKIPSANREGQAFIKAFIL